MTLEDRLAELIIDVGADVKDLQDGLAAVDGGLPAYAGVRTKPFSAIRSAYNWTPTSTQALRAALAKADAARVLISVMGHSGAAGGGATLPGQQDYAALLRQHLAGIGAPVSGTGFALCDMNLGGTRDSRMTFSGGTWLGSGNDYQPFVYIQDADAKITFQSDLPGTVAEFGVPDNTASIGLYVDDVLFETYQGPNHGGAGTAIVVRTLTGLSFARHKLEIRCTTAAEVSAFYGFRVRNTTGIEISNFGRGGAEVEDWTNNTFSSNYQVMESMGAPHIGLVQVGANEALAGTAVGSMKTEYQTLIDKMFSDGIAPVILTESVPNPGGSFPVSQATWETFLDAYYDLADDNDVPLVDLSHKAVSYATMNTLGMVAADNLHMNEYGYAFCGETIANNLFPSSVGDGEARRDLEYAPATGRPVNVQTGATYDVTLADLRKWIHMSNTGAKSISFDVAELMAAPVGVEVMGSNGSSGDLEIWFNGDFISVDSLFTVAPGGVWAAKKVIAPDTWQLFGSLI